MTKKFLLPALLWLFPLVSIAQNEIEKGLSALHENAILAQLEFLSSDWTEGRAAGSEGAYLAADYIASMFKLYGLEPGGDIVEKRFSRRERAMGMENKIYRGYFQNFPLIEYSAGEEQKLELIIKSKSTNAGVQFTYKTDFNVSPGQVSQSGTASVVFAGYGLQDDKNLYNDLDKIDVEGKIIMRLRGYPGHLDINSASYKNFHPGDRYAEWRMMSKKNELATEKGVLAILEVDTEGDSYRGWSDNVPFRFNTFMFEGDERPEIFYDRRRTFPGDSLDLSPPVFRISLRMANEILKNSGISIKQFENDLAQKAKPQSAELRGKEIRFSTSVDSRVLNVRNVVGVLKGKDTSNVIVVGAHYDHIGKYNGYIWNGADDNASGTVGVMSLARACMQTGKQPEKTIVFAAWTAEESGLWGSKYFVEYPFDNKNIILNLNYDMISRDDEDDKEGKNCSMTYMEGYPAIEEITRKNIEDWNIDLNVSMRASSRTRGGSDYVPFAVKGIPYFYFMAGFHDEYHQPDDHIELANIPKMTNIIRLGFLNLWEFSNSDAWNKR